MSRVHKYIYVREALSVRFRSNNTGRWRRFGYSRTLAVCGLVFFHFILFFYARVEEALVRVFEYVSRLKIPWNSIGNERLVYQCASDWFLHFKRLDSAIYFQIFVILNIPQNTPRRNHYIIKTNMHSFIGQFQYLWITTMKRSEKA